jgi:hypothetical protein
MSHLDKYAIAAIDHPLKMREQGSAGIFSASFWLSASFNYAVSRWWCGL